MFYKKINKAFLVRKFWRIIFQQEPSPEAIRQVDIFFVFGIGMIVAKFLAIISQVIIGRQFGPKIYGQITLILLLSSYFAMPIANAWGMAFTKIVSREKDLIKKYQVVKALLLIVFFCCFLLLLPLFLLQKYLANLLNITPQLIQLSLIMTVFYAWWIITKQITQGFQDWYAYIAIENIWASLILLGIGCLILSSNFNLMTVSGVFFVGYFFSGFVLLRKIWNSFSSDLNINYIQDIFSHGWFLLLNGLVGTATFSIDRILINRNLGEEEVGIYQAHFLSTFGIISAFMTIVLTYIFPLFCRNANIDILLRKVVKIQYPVTVFFSLLIGIVVLNLYSFPISFLLFTSLCVFNAIQFHVQLKSLYFTSKGLTESKIALLSQIIFLVVNVITILLSMKYIGIISGGLSLLIASCASLVYLIIKSDKTNK